MCVLLIKLHKVKMRNTKSGEKTKQESVWIEPLEVKRVNTDVPFIIGFGVFILFWVAISIYAFCCGNVKRFNNERFAFQSNMFYYYIVQYIYEVINEAKYAILEFIAGFGLLLLIFDILLRWTTKAFVIITIALTSMLLVLLYLLLMYATIIEVVHPTIFIPVVVITILYGFIIYAFVKSGINVVCKVIKESYKAMGFFPSTFIFGVIQFGLQLIVAVFAFSIFVYLLSIRTQKVTATNTNTTDFGNQIKENFTLENSRENDTILLYDMTIVPPHIYFFHLVNFCAFLWATWFVMGLGRIVLSSTFVTWYKAKDRNSITIRIIPKCFAMVLRYHTGTLAYASSPLSIIPMFSIIRKHEFDNPNEMYKRPILILTWFTIQLKFTFDALTMCAFRGNSLYKSAKVSYILYTKQPSSELIMITVSEYLIVLGASLLFCLSFCSIYVYSFFINKELSFDGSATAVVAVSLMSLLMSMTFFMVLRSALGTIHYCQFEDSKIKNEAEMNLKDIQVDDASSNDEHGNPYLS